MQLVHFILYTIIKLAIAVSLMCALFAPTATSHLQPHAGRVNILLTYYYHEVLTRLNHNNMQIIILYPCTPL